MPEPTWVCDGKGHFEARGWMAGYVASTEDRRVEITARSGIPGGTPAVGRLDFGVVPPSTASATDTPITPHLICVVAFLDEDEDGEHDRGERLIPGIEAQLFHPPDELIETLKTDAEKARCWRNDLQERTYQLCIQESPDYDMTTDRFELITLTRDQPVHLVKFGLSPVASPTPTATPVPPEPTATPTEKTKTGTTSPRAAPTLVAPDDGHTDQNTILQWEWKQVLGADQFFNVLYCDGDGCTPVNSLAWTRDLWLPIGCPTVPYGRYTWAVVVIRGTEQPDGSRQWLSDLSPMSKTWTFVRDWCCPREDVDGDSMVTADDWRQVRAALGTKNGRYDFNGNGIVDQGDLDRVENAIGKVCH